MWCLYACALAEPFLLFFRRLCVYTLCVHVYGMLYGVCVLMVLWYVNAAERRLLRGRTVGLCIPPVLLCVCVYGISYRVCSLDSFLLNENGVFLCFLPAKTLVPL